MVQEIDVMPIGVREKKITRMGTVREDVYTALIKRIPRFEFIGDIYTTCGGKYVGTLKRSDVSHHAYGVVKSYVYHLAKLNDKIGDFTYEDIEGFYDTFSCPTTDGERVFMEIYFDKIFAHINRLKPLCEGRYKCTIT